MCANNDLLLLCGDGELHLFDADLKLLRSTNKAKVSSSDLLDMVWCESLNRFIILTGKKVYLFDSTTMQLSHIEDVRLNKDENSFISCACSSTILFVAARKSWRSYYLKHYSLPEMNLVAHLSVIDLIGTDPPSSSSASSYKQRPTKENDARKILSIRYNQQRLAIMIEGSGEAFLYVLGSQRRSEKALHTTLPWTDGHLSALMGSSGWLLMKGKTSENFLQIDPDCRYKAEWASKDSSQSSFFSFSTGFVELNGGVTNAIMFGPSHLVLLLDNSLALYQVHS